jgi:hypothetical protein
MRAVGTLLTIALALAASETLAVGTASAATPGYQINQFLQSVRAHKAEAMLIRLRGNPIPTSDPPGSDFIYDEAPLLGGSFGDSARQKLVQALTVSPCLPCGPFWPDFCFVSVDGNGLTNVLWIDSTPSRPQMRLFVSDGTCDGAVIATPMTGTVETNLIGVGSLAASGCNLIYYMLEGINSTSSPFDLFSVNPTPVKSLAGSAPNPPWSIVGTLSCPATPPDPSACAYRSPIVQAVEGAMIPPPYHTASIFRPRLGISVTFAAPVPPGCVAGKYVLLMAFDCRKMELFIDGTLVGCCAINNTGGDQPLNDILTNNNIPLAPPTPSSGS